MIDADLDVGAVRAFVLTAELGSFTRAADVLGVSQAAISLKLKKLEDRLGFRVLARTPRYVELSPQGASFLVHARELLTAHDRALSTLTTARQRLVIGMSDHVAGPDLPTLIARMNAQDPALSIELRIASSGVLLQQYDRRELDTVIVRLHSDRPDGEVLGEESLGWFAAPDWRPRANEPLPVATLAEPCGVRALASGLLDEAKVPWTEVFVGGGVAAVAAAVMAGLGVAALVPRMLPFGAVDVGGRLGLPALPRLPIVLHSRERVSPARDVVRVLGSALSRAAR